jgi:hypothetical protein
MRTARNFLYAALSALVVSVMIVAFSGCAGTQVQLNPDAQQVLERSAVSTVGYLIAKKNPDLSSQLLTWYTGFQAITDLSDFQKVFQDGVKALTGKLVKDPYLQLQISNAMTLIQINAQGPALPAEIQKYKDAVSWFMDGVQAAQVLK